MKWTAVTFAISLEDHRRIKNTLEGTSVFQKPVNNKNTEVQLCPNTSGPFYAALLLL